MTRAQGPIAIAELAGTELGSRTISYSERDAILYALAVGAHADQTDLVFEERLRVLPPFALTLGVWAVEAAGSLGAYDRVKTLHVGQSLKVRDDLPTSGEVELEARVAAVRDKGAAALVDVLVSSPLFEATYVIYVPDGGGFGGDGGPTAERREAVELDRVVSVETSADQAALYRLTGDLHPVHIDPEVATALGFERPILHGLCTLGCAARVVADALETEPWTLRELEVRFARPVYPGATLEVAVGGANGDAHFTATAGGEEVLRAGRARFAAEASS